MCNILCLYIVSAVVGYSIPGITVVYVTPTSFVFGQVFSLFLLLCVDNGFYLFLPPSPLSSFPSLSSSSLSLLSSQFNRVGCL